MRSDAGPDSANRPRNSGFRGFSGKWLVGLLCCALTLLLLAVVLVPAGKLAQTLSLWPVIAHVLAFAKVAGCVLILCAALLVLLLTLRGKRASRAVRWSGAFCAAGWLVSGAVLMIFPEGSQQKAAVSSLQGKNVQEMTLVVYNSQDTLSAEDFKQLHSRFAPDIYVFPEAEPVRVSQASKISGLKGRVVTARDDGFGPEYSGGIAPTTLFLSQRFDALKQVSADPTTFGTVKVESASQKGLKVMGVHAAPPLPGLMGAWREDLRRIADMAGEAPGPVILAGDFNATLRHGPLADLSHMRDAAQDTGESSGTWPLSLPASWAAPIDHVLVSSSIKVLSSQTHQIGQGDHRAVVTRLSWTH